MTVQILQACLIGAHWYHAGSVVDLDDDLARRHVRAGTASEVVRVGVAGVECAALPDAPETSDADPRPRPRARRAPES